MKTEIQETSLESLKEYNNNVALKRRIAVYDVIKRLGSCPNSVIARELNLSPHKITGRVNELANYFKVVGFSHKAPCPILLEHTGDKRLVCFWKVVKDFDEWDKYNINRLTNDERRKKQI